MAREASVTINDYFAKFIEEQVAQGRYEPTTWWLLDRGCWNSTKRSSKRFARR
jgi:hypothetical protein